MITGKYAVYRIMIHALLMVVALVALIPSAQSQSIGPPSKHLSEEDPPCRKNILLIVADDFGVDLVEAYGEHPDPARTPVIDSLAADGLLFRNAWSYPTCTPARACLMTGRHAHRTGLGYHINYEASTLELSVSEETVAKILKPLYRTAAVGKWHLATKSGSGLMHPMLLGFDHHRGTMGNLPDSAGEAAYYSYEKAVDGVMTDSKVYATTDAVNDAIELIDSFGIQPWFVLLAFNAPHGPFHKPPPDLHTYTLPPEVVDDIPMHARAMAEAMDTEIGRLLSSVDPAVLDRTVIIFMGDNGTAQPVTTLPFLSHHAKTTIYEGGVNVPLIISGPGVPKGDECGAFASISDIFATVAEIAGVSYTAAEDSVSLVPYFSDPGMELIRPWAYSEKFKPNGFFPVYYERERVARDDRFKLMYFYDEYATTLRDVRFYDLAADPFELNDLMDGILTPQGQASFLKLEQIMAANER
jgi:arylsulfatase A-like enzyme